MPSNVIHFDCPACDRPVAAASQYANLPGPCPLCGAEVIVPAAEPSRPASTIILNVPPGTWPPADPTAAIGFPVPRAGRG